MVVIASSFRTLVVMLCSVLLSASVLFGAAQHPSLVLADSARGEDAPQRTITALDLATLKDIGGGHSGGAISVSPDGRWIAFQLQEPLLEKNDFRLTWLALSAQESAEPRRMGDGGEVLFNPTKWIYTNGNRPAVTALWAPDSRSFFYLKKAKGETQVWRSWLETGVQEQVTRNAADVMAISLSTDGRHLVYTVARPRGVVQQELSEEGRRGYLFDDRFPAWVGPYPSRRWCGPDLSDAHSLERDCDPDLWVFDLASGRRRLVPASERSRWRASDPTASWTGSVRFRAPTPTADGSRVAWLQADDPRTEDARSPVLRLFAGPDPGRAVVCHGADVCVGQSFEQLWWSESGTELYFLKRDRDRGRYGIYAWIPETDAVRAVIEGDDLFAHCELAQGPRAICLHEGATTPRKIVAVDLGDGSVRTLYDPNPSFRQMRFTRVRALHWEDDFGNPVFGRLVYPRGYVKGRRYPLVVMPYGEAGFLRGDVGDEYPIHVFADAGLMALNIMAPTLNEWTTLPADEAVVFEKRENRRWRSRLAALANIIAQLDAEALIDPARVGLTGLSDGMQQVQFAVINSNLIAAAAMSGIWPPEHLYVAEVPRRRAQLREWRGGAPSDDLATYRDHSFRLNAGRVEAALLVNVSDFEFPGALTGISALRDAGKAIEVHVYPNEQHIKWRPRARLSVYRRNVQWFRFWLQGVEVADPVDPEQYARWRKLRARSVR